MTVISGILGAVNGAATVRKWNINTSAEVQAFAASNTRGGMVRSPGNYDWSGQFTGYGHTPPVMPGQSFSFLGSINGLVGASGTAIVDRIDLALDLEHVRPIQWTCNFSGNGALEYGEAVVTDATTVDAPNSMGCKLQLGTLESTPVYSDLSDVSTVQLSIRCQNRAYRSSSTAGQTLRLPGNIDWSMSAAVYCSDFATLVARNTIRAVRLYVSSTEYWELLWGIFGEVGGLQVDRESAGTVVAHYGISMTGVTTIESSAAVGRIKSPSDATIWPAS